MSSQASTADAPTQAGRSAAARGLTEAAAIAAAVSDLVVELAEASAAAVRGAVTGAGQAAAAIWVADRPRRQKVRTKRRRRWWQRKGWWRFLVILELIAVMGWAGGRSAAKVVWSGRTLRRQAAQSAREGWRAGRDRAHARTQTRRCTSAAGPENSAPGSSRSSGVVIDVEIVCSWTGPDGQECQTILATDSSDPYCPRHRSRPAPTAEPTPATGEEPDDVEPDDVEPEALPSDGTTETVVSEQLSSDPDRTSTEPRPEAPAAPEGGTGPARMSVKWSPDFGAYVAGEIDVSQIRCALCGHAPCACPPFGSAEYLAIVRRAHGRTPRPSGPAEQDRTSPEDAQQDLERAEKARRRREALRTAGWTGDVDQDGYAVTGIPGDGQAGLSGRVTAADPWAQALAWIAKAATGDLPCCRCVAGVDEVVDCRCVRGEGAPMTACVCGPWDLAAAIAADDEAEDVGNLDGDERVTCHQCQNWADHAHEPFTNARISQATYHFRQLQRRLGPVPVPARTAGPESPIGRPADGPAPHRHDQNQHDQHDQHENTDNDQEDAMSVTSGTTFQTSPADGAEGPQLSTSVTAGTGGGQISHGAGPGLGGELTAVGDLRAETQHVAVMVEQCEVLASRLAEWARRLPELAAAAEWRTEATDQATAAVGEAAGSTQGLRERITAVIAAAADAQRLGEVLAAGRARGQARGLVPQ